MTGHDSGMTMIELMVTLVVASILLAIALPSFERTSRNSLLANTANNLSASMNRARAEAIKARRNVRMCPTIDNSTCANGGSWAAGWIMFIDFDGNALPDASELIQVGASINSFVSLTAPAAFSQWVQFRPSGAVIGNGGNSGNFNLCTDGYDEFSRLVGISATGRVAAKKQADLCSS